MLEEGERAPRFELPAVIDGESERVTLEEFLGGSVVVLAFYPGDFNPACDGASSGLDDLEVFAMQKGVTTLGISGDSVFSHRAFAEEYDLQIPLLADVRGEVATQYGVAAVDEPYATRRAVFVIDHEGTITDTWIADDPATVPEGESLRTAVESIVDRQTARTRYGDGHARYLEGRQAFTSAMNAFETEEWKPASREFGQAVDAFDEAREEFDTAVRFAEDKTARQFERAERKAEALGRAAGWLEDAAAFFASGEGRRGAELRRDAETPLETARRISEPPNPDELPPAEDSRRARERSPETEDEAPGPGGEPANSEGDRSTAPETAIREREESASQTAHTTEKTAGDGASSIDDEELEAITAELEEQNVAAERAAESEDRPESDASRDADTEDESLELDLTDPTEDGDAQESS